MTKPYDLAELGMKLKDAGLPVALETAEAIAGKVYLAFKAWTKESAALSENKIDDFIVAFEDQLDPIVLPLIDKIDGQKG